MRRLQHFRFLFGYLLRRLIGHVVARLVLRTLIAAFGRCIDIGAFPGAKAGSAPAAPEAAACTGAKAGAASPTTVLIRPTTGPHASTATGTKAGTCA